MKVRERLAARRGGTRWRTLAAALLLAAAPLAQPATDSGWQVRADEPRAFGHHVGDVVLRRFVIETPPGRRLDRASLPQAGRRGKSLELRAVRWTEPGWFGGRSHTLELEYQVFVSPPEVRSFEMPPVVLRFDGGARTEDLRLDAWPLTLSPLVPREPSPRTGLGDLRPDAPPSLIDTAPAEVRLAAMGALGLLALGYLAQVYWLLPWWRGRQRPFGLAWSGLRGIGPRPTPAQRQQAFRLVHRALDHTAGEVVFERGLPAFVAAYPRYAPVQADLAEFFARSRMEFFDTPTAHATGADDAVTWLRRLGRRCRDLERGAA